MYINEQTAQLIFDAIAWSNKDWEDSLDWQSIGTHSVDTDRADFVRFCRARGIEGVEKVVKIDAYREDNT